MKLLQFDFRLILQTCQSDHLIVFDLMLGSNKNHTFSLVYGHAEKNEKSQIITKRIKGTARIRLIMKIGNKTGNKLKEFIISKKLENQGEEKC